MQLLMGNQHGRIQDSCHYQHGTDSDLLDCDDFFSPIAIGQKLQEKLNSGTEFEPFCVMTRLKLMPFNPKCFSIHTSRKQIILFYFFFGWKNKYHSHFNENNLFLPHIYLHSLISYLFFGGSVHNDSVFPSIERTIICFK